MRENRFQKDLIKEIKEMFPGCVVLKNDSEYIQGIPDLTILYKNKWVTLECKKSPNENHQPNQDYYVSKYLVSLERRANAILQSSKSDRKTLFS